MKLHLDAPGGTNMIRGYAPGQLRVGDDDPDFKHARRATTLTSLATGQRCGAHRVPTSNHCTRWRRRSCCSERAHANSFQTAPLLAALFARRIGVEVMDTRAACRTYNVLVAEGRSVVAALIV